MEKWEEQDLAWTLSSESKLAPKAQAALPTSTYAESWLYFTLRKEHMPLSINACQAWVSQMASSSVVSNRKGEESPCGTSLWVVQRMYCGLDLLEDPVLLVSLHTALSLSKSPNWEGGGLCIPGICRLGSIFVMVRLSWVSGLFYVRWILGCHLSLCRKPS